jgi:hypothetical protein
VADYKLYFMNRQNHISRRIDLDCRDDEHAIEVVSEHARNADFALELWQGTRLVRRFEPAAPDRIIGG